MKSNNEHKKHRFVGLKIAAGVILGLWIIIIIILHIALSPSFLTRTANKYAAEFVDGNIMFGNIEASMFKSFPNINISINDFDITYPHDRFAAYDSIGVKSHLRNAGRSMTRDTLASFKNLSASINYMALLSGKYRIHELTLGKARIFAHKFDSIDANWNIFRSKEDNDTASSDLPHLIIRKIRLSDSPLVVFTSIEDTLFTSLNIKKATYNGPVDIMDFKYKHLNISLDSLKLAVRLPKDTIAVALDQFAIKEYRSALNVSADATAFIATKALGYISLPIDIRGIVDFPDNKLSNFSIRNLRTNIATLNITGNGDLRLGKDSTYIQAELSLNDCPVRETTDFFLKKIMPDALKLKTDAKITLTALCNGYYRSSDRTMPELIAELVIPKSSIEYEGLDYSGEIETDINAQTDKYGNLSLRVDALDAHVAGVNISMTGSAEDILSKDPLIDIDLKATASLDTIDDFLPKGMHAEGNLEAAISGMILVSDIDPYNFSRADLEGFIKSNGITFRNEPDSIFAFLDKTNIKIGKAGKDAVLGADLLGLSGTIDSLKATLGTTTFIRGSSISLTAQNAAKATSKEYGKEFHPIVGTIRAENIAMTGEDSLFVGIRNSKNSFKLSNKKEGDKTLPILSLNTDHEGIFLRKGVNRAGLKNSLINFSAVMKDNEKIELRDRVTDSLQKLYPYIPQDSLLRHSKRLRENNLPEYMREKDFEKKDISINLSKSITQYISDWTINGKLKIGEGLLISPYFPLKNSFYDIEGSFNNDEISLRNLTINPGVSDVTAKGRLSGLKKVLLGRKSGILNLDMAINSNKLDANELLRAYDAGSRYVPDSGNAMNEQVSDEQYLAEVAMKTDNDTMKTDYKMVVIPSNLNAKISLQGNEIDYSNLLINWFASDIKIKERCFQLTNTVATSNMGDIYFEGFYASKSKKDVKAGFDLNMVNITADKVITLFPAVDSIMPMLKSFKGMLDCEMAATSSLDTNMNLITPSINGIMKIKGSNLELQEEGAVKKLAKLLMFKDKKVGKIENMSVQGLIADDMLEVFPFVMNIDRYTLAMSGIQNFDQSFNYHVSVLKSPIPFRFGINLKGNFDNWKYDLGKAKYKNTNVPIFTSQINSMQMNLLNSIHNIFTKGVEIALQQSTDSRIAIDTKKKALGYDAETPSEALSKNEIRMIDSTLTAIEHPVDSILSSKIDSAIKTAHLIKGDPESSSKFGNFTQKQLDQKEERQDKRQEHKKEKAAKKEAKKESNTLIVTE